MENNNGKATSYKDLLKSFQQAENGAQTPRTRKLVYRPQHLKNSTGPSCSNAQPSNSSLRKSNK